MRNCVVNGLTRKWYNIEQYIKYNIALINRLIFTIKIFKSNSYTFLTEFYVLLTLSQTSPSVCSTSLLKTLREKEKLLIMSNFSFSQSIFHPFGELSAFSLNSKLLSAKSFNLEESKIYRLGKD